MSVVVYVDVVVVVDDDDVVVVVIVVHIHVFYEVDVAFQAHISSRL